MEMEFASDDRCVWMLAGVLTYKLCDRRFNCEACPLDAVLRPQRAQGGRESAEVAEYRFRCELPAQLDPAVGRLLEPFAECVVHRQCLYTDHRMWVRFCDGDLVFTGIDGVMAALLPKDVYLTFPSSHARVRKGNPIAHLQVLDHRITLPAPFAGTVVARNKAIFMRTRTMLEEPYALGWITAMIPDDPQEATLFLRPAADAVVEMRAKMQDFLSRSSGLLGAAHAGQHALLNDGGTEVATLEEALGPDAYSNLLMQILA